MSSLRSGHLRGQLWRYSTRIRTAVATALVLAALIGWIWPDGRPPLQEVWVADRNLPAGSVLSREDVRLGLDSLGLPLIPEHEILGRTLRLSTTEGEPISAGNLVASRGSSAFPLMLPPPASLAGIAAGDRLDIMAQTEREAADAQWHTVVTDIEVLTVKLDPSSAQSSIVVLAATAAQALMLAELTDPERIAVTIRS